MNNNSAILLAAKEVGLILERDDQPGWVNQLIEKINDLLVNDFDKLISILYRMDVSEKKIKQLLKDNPAEDAAKLIASLVIERQAEKIKSRRQFKQRENDINEDEKW
ncbi:MAG: hypothetical protein Q8941_19490 [Bacteroidota bacterium]|nr:hypothetical protein [Bacteroidota bacterium]